MLALALVTWLTTAPSPTASPTASTVPTATSLSWTQTVDRSVRESQGLLAERFVRDRAALGVPQAWAVWSPALFLDAAYRRPQLVQNTVVDDRFVDDRASYRLGVAWRNLIGTRVEASVGVDQGLGGGVTQPSVAVALEQPLLQGAWIDGAALRLTEAELQRAIQRELFRGTVNTFLVGVDAAYWDVAVAQADIEIKRRSRDRAERQFKDTEENIRRGILAEGEIYVVEESLVIFEAELRRAEQRLLVAQRALQQALFVDVDAVVAAADDLGAVIVDVPAAADAAAVAAREHPAVRAQRLRVQLAEAQARNAFNAVLPALTLRSSLGVVGADADYGKAWGNLVSEPGMTAEIGVRLTVPLDRPSIHAGLSAAELGVERERAELLRVEQQVRFEVENARAQLATDVSVWESAKKQQVLAEKKLAAQLEKYQSGLSTLQDVVRFQRELDDALIGVQRVARSVRTGRARLLAAVGTLHDDVGVGVAHDVVVAGGG